MLFCMGDVGGALWVSFGCVVCNGCLSGGNPFYRATHRATCTARVGVSDDLEKNDNLMTTNCVIMT